MNLTDRNAELEKARALSVQISQAETTSRCPMDGVPGTVKAELQQAQK